MTTCPLKNCPVTLLIVYTTGADAENKGYEPWLESIDNPFFNAIPGVGNYSNWKIETVLHGAQPPYTHFDFQGLDAEDSLEQVWFNADLDEFRKEWIRLWGYGTATPHPALANAYLMRFAPGREQGAGIDAQPRHALVTAGRGAPPPAVGADFLWSVDETVRKHFAGVTGDAWRVPARQDNPLGFEWIAVRYGDDAQALEAGYAPGAGEDVAFLARLIASPD